MEIIKLRLDQLKPYEKNAKRHTDEQIEHIINSIKRFQFCDPIGVWGEKNVIVEGHGRYFALKKMGVKEVDCIRLDHLSDEERKAYTLVHNQATLETPFDDDLLKIELDGILDIDMEDFGFETMGESSGGSPEESAEPERETSFNYAEQYGVIVMCNDEAHQEEVYTRLTEEGYNCKVVAV